MGLRGIGLHPGEFETKLGFNISKLEGEDGEAVREVESREREGGGVLT